MNNHLSNWQRQPQSNCEVTGKCNCYWEIAITVIPVPTKYQLSASLLQTSVNTNNHLYEGVWH